MAFYKFFYLNVHRQTIGILLNTEILRMILRKHTLIRKHTHAPKVSTEHSARHHEARSNQA